MEKATGATQWITVWEARVPWILPSISVLKSVTTQRSASLDMHIFSGVSHLKYFIVSEKEPLFSARHSELFFWSKHAF